MDIEQVLKASIGEICGIDVSGLTSDSKLKDIGVDSLASAEILVDIEIRLGRQLPAGTLRRLEQTDTLGDLSALLDEAFAAGAAGDSS